MSVPAEEIVVTAAGGVVTIALNRPAKRNAVSLAMWRRLAEIFAGVGRQDGARAVVLTGTGSNFCAGADISEFATVRADSSMGEAYEAVADSATRAVRDCDLPTIAAVSGYAMGGGCGLALACDFRIGDDSTRMGIPAARLGIVYGPLDCSLLLRQVGLANAKRVLYSGRAFDLADCRRMGLVDVAAEQGSALEAAHAFAANLSANAPCRSAAPSSCWRRWLRAPPTHAPGRSTPSLPVPWTARTTRKAPRPLPQNDRRASSGVDGKPKAGECDG